jgi:hypothetical protein
MSTPTNGPSVEMLVERLCGARGPCGVTGGHRELLVCPGMSDTLYVSLIDRKTRTPIVQVSAPTFEVALLRISHELTLRPSLEAK